MLWNRKICYRVRERSVLSTPASVNPVHTLTPPCKIYFNIVMPSAYTIFGPKRDGVTGEWRKLHNEELNDLYSSPSIVRVVKSRRMRWAGHVVRMKRERCAQGFGGET